MPWLDLWVLCRVGAVLGVVLIAARGVLCATVGVLLGWVLFEQQFQKHS